MIGANTVREEFKMEPAENTISYTFPQKKHL